jgi:rRNA maturation endonuclease Nob1
MNKFEEAIQIARVTNFLRMKAIANNDIEELHKRRYAVCKCEFRNPDNDKCNSCGCPLQLRNCLPKRVLKAVISV